ncbi:MAG: IS200/IS605 family transposase [Bacteroidota bacterium]
MPQSLAQIYLHIVFSTKHRFPFLSDDGVRNEMHAYLGGVCNNLGCQVISVGGVADHVHILCRLSRMVTVAKLLEEVKKNSSKWVKTKRSRLAKFAWQNGYGAFSVSQSQIENVRRYIARQEAHHRRQSFQEEYLALLEKYETTFDLKYLWD